MSTETMNQTSASTPVATRSSREPSLAVLLMLAAIGAAYLLTILLAPGIALVIALLVLLLGLIVSTVRVTVALRPENEP